MKFFLKLFTSIVLLIFVSCTEHQEYVIKGRLVKDCQSNEPVANQSFTFRSDSNNDELFSQKKGLNRIVTTDANGYFEFTYSSKRLSRYPIYIADVFFSDKDSTNHPINPGENVDLGVFPIGLSFNYTINLNVSNPYTSNDTLFVLGAGNTVLQTIPGPFSSGQVGTFNYPYAQGNLEYDANGFYKLVFVQIKSNILANPSSSSQAKKWFTSESKIRICDYSTHEFDVVID